MIDKESDTGTARRVEALLRTEPRTPAEPRTARSLPPRFGTEYRRMLNLRLFRYGDLPR